MTAPEILIQLQSFGSDQIKKILMKHGAKEPLFGVKIEDMKKLLKGNKGNNALAIELFGTGNYDAMYLAGLIADGSGMSVEEIRSWAETAYGSGISEFTVPWVATEHPSGYELAKEWIESDRHEIAVTGWATFSTIISVLPDEKLDHSHLKSLLKRVAGKIGQSPDPVRLAMNSFVISAGCFVPSLMEESLETAGKIGTLKVVKHGTACKVPSAAEYINKVNKMGRTGRKRANVKC